MTNTLTAEHRNVSTPQTFGGTIALADSWDAYSAAALRTLDAPTYRAARVFPALNRADVRSALGPIASYYDLPFESWPADEGASSPAASALIAKAREGAQGRHDHVVVAPPEGPYTLVAAIFALATGKRLVVDVASRDSNTPTWPADSRSATLIGPASLFSKPVLRTVLRRWRDQPDEFCGLGILTARTPEELSLVVCRQLIHRWWRATGRRSALPAPAETPAIRSMVPLEYYVLTGHGSETHLDHTDDEVLCTDPLLTAAGEGRWTCVEPAHIPARQLAVHHLLVLSCDLFTPSGGIAPSSNCLFHDLVAGWPCNIIAPFKHAQINAGYTMVADSLVRAGYPLGEITRLLNAIAPRGAEPDASYLLFGDPETRICPEAAEASSAVDIAPDAGALRITGVPRGGRVIDCTIDDGELIDVSGRIVAPTPVSAALAVPDVIVATVPRTHQKQTRFLVVANRDLPDEPLSFRVGPVDGLADDDRLDLMERVDRLDFLEHLGLDAALVRTLRERLLMPIRQALAFPRAIDFMLGAPAAQYTTAVLAPDLASVRRDVLSELRSTIARDRSWFSHRYRKAYFTVRPVTLPVDASCPECRGGLGRWLYEDPAGRAKSRTVDLCERCGIVADRPARNPIVVEFVVGAGTAGLQHRQRFVITNQLDQPVAGSLAAQFNEWETLGIEADPSIVDFELESRGHASVEVEFVFGEARAPDLISLHCYAMTDRCDLTAFTRRLVLGGGLVGTENPL